MVTSMTNRLPKGQTRTQLPTTGSGATATRLAHFDDDDKQDSGADRFRRLARQLVNVPKEEIDAARAREEQK